MLSGLSFRSIFVFSINSLILSGFPLTSFHSVEVSLSALVCAVFQKYHEITFINNYSHFSTHFAINMSFFEQLENFNKLWKSKRTVHVNERNQSKTKTRSKSKQKQNQATSHSNWPRVALFDLAHKQCNGIIKGCLHCVTSDSKGRFLCQ